jgi:hypothetical protein
MGDDGWLFWARLLRWIVDDRLLSSSQRWRCLATILSIGRSSSWLQFYLGGGLVDGRKRIVSVVSDGSPPP